ncbi:MAG: TPM domain-containing protein [Candidatus Eremiobacteraeota bacterium]|nr:TPM domain-containing protein [Candidatus Eremiobacteraeota bacterium]
MKAVRAILRALLLVAVVASAAGAEVPIPPAPSQWATDTAGILAPQTVADLNARLHAYETATGHQVLVYVGTTTLPAPTEDWTVKAFAKWKVGRKRLDDGVVLFVFPKDRAARIEVGYGLEPVLPDVTASRILREAIVPEMKAGHPDAAVTAGVGRILATIGGASGTSTEAPSAGAGTTDSYGSPDSTPLSPFTLVLIGIGILIFIIIFIRSPSTALWLLFTIMNRGGSSYSGGGGGFSSGFSGGGGSSGGGGATGRW